jgi:hypothetical protein
MSNLKTIFSALTGGLFKDIRGLVDDVVTSKEEKLQIASKLKIAELTFQERADELELKYQDQITGRQKIDMTSDSWLSKNIRPMGLIFLLLSFTTLSILNGLNIGFNFDESLIDVYKTWGGYALMFYYGFRGVEKIVTIAKSK